MSEYKRAYYLKSPRCIYLSVNEVSTLII